MFKHLRRLTAASLMFLCVSATQVGNAYAWHQGICAFNAWTGGSSTGQWYYEHYADFNDVYGWVTDRALFPCEGGSGGGWSFTAAVNIQSDNHPGVPRWIFQLGILQTGGNGGDQNYFVKTKADGSGDYVILNGIRPTFGQRYMFRIYKGSADGKIHYQIKDVAGNVLYATNTNTTWTNDMDHAWWGWETGNSESMPGIHLIDPTADLVGLYHVIGAPAGLVTKTNITPHAPVCPRGNNCDLDWPNTQMNVTGGGNEIFNVENP